MCVRQKACLLLEDYSFYANFLMSLKLLTLPTYVQQNSHIFSLADPDRFLNQFNNDCSGLAAKSKWYFSKRNRYKLAICLRHTLQLVLAIASFLSDLPNLYQSDSQRVEAFLRGIRKRFFLNQTHP